jgi:hypothetical protein
MSVWRRATPLRTAETVADFAKRNRKATGCLCHFIFLLIVIKAFVHVGHGEHGLLAPQPVLAVYPHGLETATGLPVDHANAILGCHELQVSFIETRAGGDVRIHPVESLRDGAPLSLQRW